MKLRLVPTTKFKKDVKRLEKRGLPLNELYVVIGQLLDSEKLDAKHKDHALVGRYAGFRECHIRPDWLLVYAINAERLILTASRTGTHADLFDE